LSIGLKCDIITHMAKIAEDKKGLVFKMLAEKPMYDVGLEFGLDKQFKTVSGLRGFVHRIYNEVRQDPEKFGVAPETATQVVTIVQSRSPIGKGDQKSLHEKQKEEDSKDIRDYVLEGRKKAYKLLSLKMDDLMSSKKKISESNLATLAQTFGILFDKGQIVKGEATEHVALMAKITKDITPEEAMNLILKTREGNIEEKVPDSKK
jgi:hypothetical protein